MVNIDCLKAQVQEEYQAGYNYVRTKREKKRESIEKYKRDSDKPGKVTIPLIYKYMQLFMSVVLLDELNVDFIPLAGFLAKEISINAKRIAEFDQEAMDKFDLDYELYFNAGFFGTGIVVFDGYDEIEDKPIARSIDPLSVIPDPLNWKNSDLRFIGWSRKTTYEILIEEGYENLNRMALEGTESIESRQNREYRDDAGDYNTTSYLTGAVEVYDHFTIYKGKKYLTTWNSGRDICLRCIEIEPKTAVEKKRPSKVKFPIEIFRISPVPGDFFGKSFPDLVGQYQDQISVITNLQMILARKVALGSDKFIKAGSIDTRQLNNKQPGGRYIPVKVSPGDNISNIVQEVREDSFSNFPDNMKNEMLKLAEDSTGISSLAFGQSPSGSQTKAEIQTTQKNTNQLLGYLTTFIQRANKGFWNEWYKSYLYNMSPKSKKYIVLTRGGQADSYGFSRKDFLTDQPIFIKIESKGEEAVRKASKFAKLQVLSGSILPNLQKDSYEFNEFMRELIISSGLDVEDAKRFVKYTPDEQRAIENLELLNRNEDVPSPKPGEDYNTYLSIYDFAIDNNAKTKAIKEYRDAYINSGLAQPQLEGGEVNQSAVAQAGNIVASELGAGNQTPSVQDVIG